VQQPVAIILYRKYQLVAALISIF